MTLPSVPDLKVEFAFDNDPLTASPTWTDVSSYVRSTFGLSTNRGKQDELSTYAAGRCSFTLDNRTRLFDPSYAAGTYYGKLRPRTGVRVTARWSSVDYVMFRGFVEGWPVGYPGSSRDATVTVEAYDLLALLSETTLEDAAYEYLYSVATPRVMLRKMQNGRWIDAVSGATLPRRSSFDSYGDVLAPGPGDPVEFNGTTYFSSGDTSNAFIGTRGLQGGVSFWLQTTDTGTSATEWAVLVADAYYIFGIDNNGYLTGTYLDGGSNVTFISDSKVNDGSPHHVILASTTQLLDGVRLYVDGEVHWVEIGLADWDGVGSVQYIGKKYPGYTAAHTTYNGVLQDVFSWTGVMSNEEAQEFYKVSAGRVLESTADRFSRILEFAEVPAGLISATTSAAGTVSDLVTESASALSQLQTVADSEQGRMFVAKDGKATLHDRYWWRTQTRGTTVQVTFADQPGAGEYPMSSLGFDYNVREVQNQITVTGSQAASHTEADTTSIGDYGTQSATVSTLLASQDAVVDMATGLLLLRKTPVIRLDAITVQPARNTAMWPTVLGLEIGDRIKVQVTPRGVGSERSEELLLESISWQVSAESWTVQFKGSPVPTADFGTWDESGLTYDDGTLYAF